MARIAIGCDWFLKYAAPQAIALRELGIETALLCRDHPHEFGGEQAERAALLRAVAESGVELIELPGRVSGGAAIGASRQALRALRAWRPDLVHLHDNQDPRLAWLARRELSVLTVHDPTPHPGAVRVGLAREWLRARNRAAADGYVVHGERLAAELRSLLRDPERRPIEVVRHGATVAASAPPPPQRPSVLLFGRLEPYKGISVLIEAMRQVRERDPQVRLVIAGEGPEAARIPAVGWIEFERGYVAEPRIAELLAAASVVALPYTEASQSGVGALAIGAGVPCVVSDLGGLDQLVTEPFQLIAPGDPGALAAAIEATLAGGSRLRRRTLAHAEAHFSWRRAAEMTLPLYERLGVWL